MINKIKVTIAILALIVSSMAGAAVELTTQVKGVLPTANGGTGNSTGAAAFTNALKSATTTVDVSASSAPVAGQVLVATGGSAATWQTAAGAANDQYADATGTGDAITASYPSAPSVLIDGARLSLNATSQNTITNPTFAPTLGGVLQTARTIVKANGLTAIALAVADMPLIADLRYDLPNTRWVLLNPVAIPGTAALATSLAGGSGGTIPYQSASGTTAMLANGTAGKMMQSNGTTLAPSWTSAIAPTSINGVTTDSTTNRPLTAATGANISGSSILPFSASTLTATNINTTSTLVATSNTAGFQSSPATGTNASYYQSTNTGGSTYWGLDTSTGGTFATAGNYGTIIYRSNSTGFAISRTNSVDIGISGSGLVSIGAGGLTSTAGTTTLGPTVIGTHLAASNTAPTIASGFGTSPTITASANTMAFQINVGTGGTATGGVITMPAATTGWACNAPYNGSSAGMQTYAVATNTTTVTLTNETSATGAAVAWPASTVLNITCTGF